MGNSAACSNCISQSPLCCDRPLSEYDVQNPDARLTEKELNYFKKRKRNMIGDLTTNDVLVNENRSDYFPPSIDKLPLQRDSFLVSQRSCSMENIRFLSFSQKRFTGFRNFYEFEQKRVLLANDNQIKILAYHPSDISKGVRLTRPEDSKVGGWNHLPDPAEQSSNAMLLCCGGTYSNNRQDLVEPNTLRSNLVASSSHTSKAESTVKDGPTESAQNYQLHSQQPNDTMPIQMISDEDLDSDNFNQVPMTAQSQRKLLMHQRQRSAKLGDTDTLPCQKFEVVTQYGMPENERIIYAGFLYDQNPTFVLVISANDVENCSYLSLGKISQDKTNQSNQGDIEDSEQLLKRNLARKLEINPNAQKVLQRNEGQMNMTLNLTPSTLKILEQEQDGDTTMDELIREEGLNSWSESVQVDTMLKKNKKSTFVLQKVTKFEGILIQKVFFSNKNIYGNLMLSTCKQVEKQKEPDPVSPAFSDQEEAKTPPEKPSIAENLMIHRLKDLFSVQSDGRMVNCPKLGVYIPKDFVQSRRFPVNLGFTMQEGAIQMPPSIFNVELFSEMFMATFNENVQVIIFNKTSRVVACIDLQGMYLDTASHVVRSVDFAIFPRLEWSDRIADIYQQNQKIIPKKLIFSGQDSENCAYVMIYDRAREKPSAVYIFDAFKGRVTALKYGPYDNGHVVVGFDSGIIAILDSIQLKKLFERQIFEVGTPVQCITFDPTNLVLASTKDGEVVSLSLLENKVKYTYLDMGQNQFVTVQQPASQTVAV